MDKQISHHKIVLRGHLNDYGNLFGGYLLQWIDEIGYISVSLDFPGQNFVTIGLDNVEFKHSIREGQILRFACLQTRVGNSSVTYHVQVFGERYKHDDPNKVLFETNITFVCIDQSGQKKSITSE
ncbi:MAG: acyl-CoA thioesterase [Arenicella sp.]